jgi:hypothetical protein
MGNCRDCILIRYARWTALTTAHRKRERVHNLHQCTDCTTITYAYGPAFSRCRIEMYFKDHAPPHFHIITGSGERVAVVIESVAYWQAPPMGAMWCKR